jgi:hypothetical protein
VKNSDIERDVWFEYALEGRSTIRLALARAECGCWILVRAEAEAEIEAKIDVMIEVMGYY